MHICFISSEFPLPNASYGGIGTFLLTYSKLLINNGHRVSVVGLHDKEETEVKIEGVNIFYGIKSNIKGFSWLKNSFSISSLISKIHKKDKIDILEAQEGGFAFIKIPKNVKRIVRLHGGHHFFHTFENKKLNFKKSLLEKLTFKKTDAVIATSDFVKIQTSKFINFSKKKNITINNPILIDQFYPADKSKVINNTAVFAGTICEKKGIRQLCLAIPEILKEFPEFHLYIYGRDWYFPNGTLYKDWMLKQLSDDIKKSITFKNPVPYIDLPKVYEFGEICIFPSHMEVQGLVAPEAMCMEKIVVFTEYGPGSETITDGVDGFLCKPLEVENISKTVIRVLKNRNNNREIEIRARKKVIDKFSPKIILKKNIDFYNSIL
ncbi:glycosyltransferase family 4 protein [Polaribacter sp. KT 15]|uniref:glycosyltransferase family 4 protein n=1 Tax=Polaribacter sp. KT 15 TaxID=1896175 RepID=UPI00090BC688|nr:glycosyltransferase family 4 protein [Polaribacter sp. KT 15]SHN09646.1 Glycosyltransferase involved in cell wall bisynthesis [Polaribacter sp. KT 15]